MKPWGVEMTRLLSALAAAFAVVAAVHATGQPSQQASLPQGAIAAPAPGAANAAQLSASDGEIAGFFDDYFAETIRRLELPGGAVVVVRNNRTILAKGYGYADITSKRPVDVEQSLFRAASISKLLPWLLVMQLVEEGRLNLDSDVNAYLDFKIPEAFGRPITMRHLMTHTAGFPERFHGAFDPDLSRPLGEVLRENFPERVYAPGGTVAYSNYGAALAGYIVERLRGQPWERVVAERIFTRLGMEHATVAQPVPSAMQPFLVSTYHFGSEQPGEFRTTPLAPMGSLTASAEDMGRILTMLASEGKGGNGRVLAQRSLQRMLTLQKPLATGLKDGLGLGFLVGEYRGVRYAGHGGNMTTLATDLEILPDHGLGWYYVFNGQGEREQARQVREELLFAVIGRFAAEQGPYIQAQLPSSAADVAGKYISTRRLHSGPLMFSGLLNTTDAAAHEDGSLTIESSGRATRWLAAGRDRFVEEKTGIPLVVTRGPDGQVARIASALLYPVAEYERAPLLTFVGPLLAAFAVGTIFLVLLAKLFIWGVRWRRRKAAAIDRPLGAATPVSATADQVRKWARISFWMIVGTMFAWAAFALALAIDFTILFLLPAMARVFLGILTYLSALFAAVIVADAILAWRDRQRGLASRIGAAIVAVGAVAAAGLFYIADFVNFSFNW